MREESTAKATTQAQSQTQAQPQPQPQWYPHALVPTNTGKSKPNSMPIPKPNAILKHEMKIESKRGKLRRGIGRRRGKEDGWRRRGIVVGCIWGDKERKGLGDFWRGALERERKKGNWVIFGEGEEEEEEGLGE